MPRSLLSVPLAYSDFWELAGGGGQPAGGGKGEKGRKGKMSRDGGGVAEPMEGWQRVGRGGVIGENGVPLGPRGGEVDLSGTKVDLSLECEDKERRNAGSATRFTALLGISGDRAAENGFHY